MCLFFFYFFLSAAASFCVSDSTEWLDLKRWRGGEWVCGRITGGAEKIRACGCEGEGGTGPKKKMLCG